MSDLKWATVDAASPLMLLIDGSQTAVPAIAPLGLSLAKDHRVLCTAVGRTLTVIDRYS